MMQPCVQHVRCCMRKKLRRLLHAEFPFWSHDYEPVYPHLYPPGSLFASASISNFRAGRKGQSLGHKNRVRYLSVHCFQHSLRKAARLLQSMHQVQNSKHDVHHDYQRDCQSTSIRKHARQPQARSNHPSPQSHLENHLNHAAQQEIRHDKGA